MRGSKRYLFFVIIVFFAILLKVDANTYEEYKIGDIVTYDGMKFYVIEDSEKEQSYVTLLKQQPLTVDEVNTYGVDKNGVNRVNKYILSSTGRAKDVNGYGGIAYYTSETCRNLNYNMSDGCTTDYNKSDVKYIIDAWVLDKIDKDALKEDEVGYKARLLTNNELTDNFGYVINAMGTAYIPSAESTPLWINGLNYEYWTMSAYEDSNENVWVVTPGGSGTYRANVKSSEGVVRPVVNLNKDFITKHKKKTMSDSVFEIGDMVEYNEMDFYVIKNSKQSDNTVTLIKKEPLRNSEMSNLIKSTEILNLIGKEGAYLSIPYFFGQRCVTGGDITGCTNDFSLSLAKQILDVWSSSRLKQEDLASDSLGYKVRLITYDEYIENCEIEEHTTVSSVEKKIIPLYEWMVNSNYRYWTMTPSMDDYDDLYLVTSDGNIASNSVATYHMIRPVITLKKANYNEDVKVDKNNQIVSVPDTFLEKSVIVVIIGLLLTIFGTIIGYTVIKKKKFTKNK